MNLSSPLLQLAVAAGLIYMAYKHGSPAVKGMALGAAGFMVMNNIPVANAGLKAQLLSTGTGS